MANNIKLCWNVYRDDWNANKIEVYNVFNHSSFNKDVQGLLMKKDISREEFEESVKRYAQYYFWAKCEYEIILTSWPIRVTQEGLKEMEEENNEFYKRNGKFPPAVHSNLAVASKIDIYDQLMLNFKSFVEYIWNTRKVK